MCLRVDRTLERQLRVSWENQRYNNCFKLKPNSSVLNLDTTTKYLESKTKRTNNMIAERMRAQKVERKA